MPSNLPLTEDEKLAIHEAGHALMFDALGVPIKLATIEAGCAGEESSYEGCVKLGRGTNNVCDVIAGTLAGPGASFFIAGEPMNLEAMLKFRSDQKKIHEIYSNEEDAGPWANFWNYLQLFQGTWLRVWLVKHQAAIERFSRGLIARRTLSAEELAQSLRDAWDGSKPEPAALHNEVAAEMNTLLNGHQESQLQDDDLTLIVTLHSARTKAPTHRTPK